MSSAIQQPQVIFDKKGQSQDLKATGESIDCVLILSGIVVYLVLAAQFDSWIYPRVIMLTVALAMGGALLGLYLKGLSLNIYSQIGLIMLAAKNGILIVEFSNHLRDDSRALPDALTEVTRVLFRPIAMTGVMTPAGSVLLLSSGVGSETRVVVGTVIMNGLIATTLFNLLWVLGLTAVIVELPSKVLKNTDLMMLVASSALIIAALVTSRQNALQRSHGVVFVLLYPAYLCYVIQARLKGA